MSKIENTVKNNRIVYIDPNDVHGHINGVPMTPDYTDYSIWCNLIVERPSRLKNQAGGTDRDDKIAIGYDLMKASKGNEYVSFLQGEDVDNYNYLTTDYTNIDFNEVKKRNFVEGLQIESISISMANYTCPHVTIKFIDIRGAGFFGREEATHNEYGNLKDLELDKDGKIMDNIFGGFVTFPYPRFKLQVKGFYGKDVTYQLTCSNFIGTFNSGTGNFEITVQFIGYEYGVLGDIPFDYIVAAPLTKRGSAYWDEQVRIAEANNSNGWMITYDEDTRIEPPFKLYEFYKNVKAAIEEIGDSDESEILLDEAISTSINDYDQVEEDLTLINSYINTLKTAIQNAYGIEYITSAVTADTEVMMIHSQSKTITINNEITSTYNALGNAIEDFEYKHPELEITSKLIPNCRNTGEWSEWQPGTVSISSFTEYKNNNEDIGINVLTALDGESNKTSGNIIQDKTSCLNVKVKYYNDSQNEEMSIPAALSEQIYKNYSTWEWSQRGSNYARYAAVIDFHGITSKVGEVLTDLKIKRKEYTETLRNTKHKTIKDIVGFTPYIGGYFKIVMCHLETFVALCNQTADAIYQEIDNGLRKPAKLGIYNLDTETDVPSYTTKQVPPFPAVYRKYTGTAEEIEQRQMVETKDTKFDGWVGNFIGPTEWQEKVLVDELFLALQDILLSKRDGNEKLNHQGNDEIAHFSLLPRDLRRNIPSYVYSSKENMALYTALRAEAIFNQLHHGEQVTDDVAAKFGAMDAYNLVNQAPSMNKLVQLNKVASEGKDLASELLNVVTLQNTGRSDTYSFEFAKVTNDRQPVFKENGSDKLDYVYMYTQNKGGIVPMNEYVDFNSDSVKNDYEWVDNNFKVKDVNDSAYIFTQKTEDFLRDNDNTSDEVQEYLNTQMFDVDGANDNGTMDSNQFMESSIFEQYDKITNGDIPVGTMTGDKIKGLIDDYWLIDSHCLSFYKNNNKNNYKPYQESLASDSESKICRGAAIPDGVCNITTAEKTKAFIKNFKNKVKL